MRKYCVAIIIMLSMSVSFCQTYSDESTIETAIEDGSITQITDLNPQVLNILGFGTETPTREVTGNSVFITQIGELNAANINVTAVTGSNIDLSQNGNENFTFLNYNVNTVLTNLQQNGDRNTIIDIVNNRQANISLDLEQNGNDLRFEKFGTSEVVKNLQFTQTEASPLVIIRTNN